MGQNEGWRAIGISGRAHCPSSRCPLLRNRMSLRPRTLPPGFIAPCLPTRAPSAPSGDQWWHEIKHDGIRLIARKEDKRVKLYSRPGNDLTHRFPQIVEALARLRSRSCIIDGEVVAGDESGVASFDPFHSRLCERNFMSQERLQRRLAAILFADVVGYSRLTGQDELGTWRRLQSILREVVRPHLKAHAGRIIRIKGDGIFGGIRECGGGSG